MTSRLLSKRIKDASLSGTVRSSKLSTAAPATPPSASSIVEEGYSKALSVAHWLVAPAFIGSSACVLQAKEVTQDGHGRSCCCDDDDDDDHDHDYSLDDEIAPNDDDGYHKWLVRRAYCFDRLLISCT